MSVTCPNCGTVNRDAHRFCSNCGAALSAAPATSTPSEPEPASTQPVAPAAAGGASFSLPPRTGASTEPPVTYVVQKWDNSPPGSEPNIPAPPPTAAANYVPPTDRSPYGAYSGPAATTPVQQTQRPGVERAPEGIRREGGAYAPYSPEAVAALEKQQPNRRWLIPSILGVVALLVVLGGVAVVLLFTPAKGTTSSGISPAPQNVGSEEDTVKAVIRQSNEEQITAWKNLDTEILKGTRTGQVLLDNIQMVEKLRRDGQYAVPENVSLEFGDINVTGNTATAKTVEVWTVTFFNKSDNQRVFAQGPYRLRETYHLVKQDGKWLISDLEYEEETPPPASPGTTG